MTPRGKANKTRKRGGQARPAGRASRRRPAARTARPRSTRRVLRARDLMTRTPITVPADLKVGALCDLLQVKNINGAPVVDAQGSLVGVVTQEDIIYGAMGHAGGDGEDEPSAADPTVTARRRPSRSVVEVLRGRQLRVAPPLPPRSGERPFWAGHRSPDPMEMPVRTIMTSPAISAEEDTPVTDLCNVMWSLRIHRVPILKKGKVTGLVSSMDLCRAILEGKIRVE